MRAAVWAQVTRGAIQPAAFSAGVGLLAGSATIGTAEMAFGLGRTIGVQMLQILVLGQMAGFVAALLLVAGAGTAAVFEVGRMQLQGELRTLRLMGVDPVDFLVLPRIIGFGLSLFLLTLAFQVGAALGGAAVVAAVSQLTFSQLMAALIAGLAPRFVLWSAAQSLVLGGLIGALVCREGLARKFSVDDLPRIARQLLARSLVIVVVVQGAAAVLVP